MNCNFSVTFINSLNQISIKSCVNIIFNLNVVYFTSLVIVRQLDKNTVGYITYREGLQSSLNTTVITESEDTKAQVTIQV